MNTNENLHKHKNQNNNKIGINKHAKTQNNRWQLTTIQIYTKHMRTLSTKDHLTNQRYKHFSIFSDGILTRTVHCLNTE